MSLVLRFSIISVLFCVVFGIAGCSDYDYYSDPVVVDTRPVYRPTMYKNQPIKTDTYSYSRSKTTPKDNSFYSNSSLNGKTIVIDPGHGGHDPGAGEAGFSTNPEKYIVLSIATELASNLRSCGARVIMTRKDDRFIELLDRAAMADMYRADLFVSIHADSCPDNTSAIGPTVYIARSASRSSRIAAMKIHSTFSEYGFQSRGVRRADYKVLVNHSRPSVLVECGYLTNWQEAKRLNSSWYQSRIARALSKAICEL